MSKKSIGILAYYWPPAGGSGVQRWLRFSNHLCDLGWDVHVFTFKNPKYPILNNSNVEKINPLIKVNKINGLNPEVVRDRVSFEHLTPFFPNEKFNIADKQNTISTRVMDLFCPIGKGQRGMIVSLF